MKYRMIVLDLDGTLTNSRKEITPRNRETLIHIQKQGIRLALASGRPTYGIVPLADELSMREHGGFILSYNGGEIIDWATGELIHAKLLPNDVIPILYQSARAHGLSILGYHGNHVLTEHPDDEYVKKRLGSTRCRYAQPPIFLPTSLAHSQMPDCRRSEETHQRRVRT